MCDSVRPRKCFELHLEGSSRIKPGYMDKEKTHTLNAEGVHAQTCEEYMPKHILFLKKSEFLTARPLLQKHHQPWANPSIADWHQSSFHEENVNSQINLQEWCWICHLIKKISVLNMAGKVVCWENNRVRITKDDFQRNRNILDLLN